MGVYCFQLKKTKAYTIGDCNIPYQQHCLHRGAPGPVLEDPGRLPEEVASKEMRYTSVDPVLMYEHGEGKLWRAVWDIGQYFNKLSGM